MKPPVELVRPTLLNILAIICYCLAILFHVIAYASNGWSSLILDGVRWDMGLWEGCRDTEEGIRICSKNAFDADVFITGMSKCGWLWCFLVMFVQCMLVLTLVRLLLLLALVQHSYKEKRRTYI